MNKQQKKNKHSETLLCVLKIQKPKLLNVIKNKSKVTKWQRMVG